MKKIVSFLVFVGAFFVLLLTELICLSNASFSDFFTTETVSSLKDKPNEITKEIIVDASCIHQNGGMKTLTENLINGMACKRPHWRFIVLTDSHSEDPPKFNNMNNIKILSVDRKTTSVQVRDILNFATFGLFRDQITQLLFYNKICFNHNCCNLFFDPYAEMQVNDFSIPKVSLIHDLLCVDLPEVVDDRRRKWIKNNSDLIARSSQKIITVSNFSKKRIMEEYKLPDDLVQTIHIKLASRIKNNSLQNEATILKKYDLTKRNYLIYTSSWWVHKNHKRLLEAFAKFLSASPSNVKLIVVGQFDNDIILPIKNMSIYPIIKDNVIFTGFVPDEELNILLSNAMAMVFPSLYEGFGMPIIEAMNAGVPVICSNAGSLPEVAGKAALFFDPYNINEIASAISTIVSNEDLRKNLIRLGYKQADQFNDRDAMLNEYIKVFEEVMK